jgi:hypothetical protein
MEHASYGFPSHLVLLLEAGLLVPAALAWRCWPERLAAAARAVLSPFDRLGRWRRVATFAMLAAVGNAGVCALYGPPIPRVSDELGYLLAADTLSHGRLANPPPPHPALVGRHALSSPSYAAKYPIGQGALLALGQLLGSPVIGLWLGAALLCGAAVWCFDGWLRPPTATAAALLLLLRLGIGSYWNQSYWGGSLAAAGGLLLYGGLGWIRRERHLEGAAAAGGGGALLILTRPFEGLLAALPALAWLAAVLWKMRTAGRRRLVGSSIALPVLLALGVTAAHDRAVTGDALLLPHVLFERTHTIAPEWVWSRFDAATGTTVYVDRPRTPGDNRGWWRRSLRYLAGRMARIAYFALGVAMVPVLVLAPRCRDPRWRLSVLACAAVLAGNAVVDEYHPHYSAPLLAPLYLAAFLALDGLGREPGKRSTLAWGAVLAALATSLVTAAVQLPAHRPDAVQPSYRMQQARERLAAAGGRHLVMTPDAQDLVFNGADLVDAPVLWAAPADAEDWRELKALFPDRQVWWFDPTARPPLVRESEHRRSEAINPPDAPPPAPS